MISAFDILYEIVIVASSFTLVWGLNAPTSTKVNVVLAFAFRLLCVTRQVLFAQISDS